jgi:hypothetical protein
VSIDYSSQQLELQETTLLNIVAIKLRLGDWGIFLRWSLSEDFDTAVVIFVFMGHESVATHSVETLIDDAENSVPPIFIAF